tara:strand:- start:229 stop:573 length:345 start_codon:yes stop_codon:yes gene_type:complete
MIADIYSKVNLSAVTSSTVGSSAVVSRLKSKSVFITALTNGSGTGTGSQLFVTVDASPDDSTWYTIDSKRYESGTATQDDVFSYDSHFPFIRTTTIGSNIGALSVSTTITGRGV